MNIVEINKYSVVVDGAFHKSLGGETVVCCVEDSVEYLPRNTFNVVNGVLGINIHTVADGNSAARVGCVGVVCHLLCEDCVILKILLNTDNINAALVEKLTHYLLGFRNNLAVLVKF